MTSAAPGAAGGGYRPALALRHLWRGALAPGEAMREALRARIGETARLLLLGLAAAALGLADPETRGLGRAAVENVLDDPSRLHGLMLLATGSAVIGLALAAAYWIAALAAHAFVWPSWSRASLARMRSAVALGAWFALLPTLAVKLAALALLPARMIAADPPSLYTAIELTVAMPYFAACLMAAFGTGPARAVLVAILVNGTFYLLLLILYFMTPSP